MKNLAAALLFFAAFSAGAQYSIEDAEQDLQRLKNGALLVRLPTDSLALAKLQQLGKTDKAERRAENRRRQNEETLLSFRHTFDFCPVYFFYAKDSEKIRVGQLDGTIFTDRLFPVRAENLPKTFLTAEFGTTPNLGIDGLIIMNQNLIPLQAPFPFYQREHIVMGLFKISKAKMASNLNAKLWRAWELWGGGGDG